MYMKMMAQCNATLLLGARCAFALELYTEITSQTIFCPIFYLAVQTQNCVCSSILMTVSALPRFLSPSLCCLKMGNVCKRREETEQVFHLSRLFLLHFKVKLTNESSAVCSFVCSPCSFVACVVSTKSSRVESSIQSRG